MVILAEQGRSGIYDCGMAKPAQKEERMNTWEYHDELRKKERRICGTPYRLLGGRKKKLLI